MKKLKIQTFMSVIDVEAKEVSSMAEMTERNGFYLYNGECYYVGLACDVGRTCSTGNYDNKGRKLYACKFEVRSVA